MWEYPAIHTCTHAAHAHAHSITIYTYGYYLHTHAHAHAPHASFITAALGRTRNAHPLEPLTQRPASPGGKVIHTFTSTAHLRTHTPTPMHTHTHTRAHTNNHTRTQTTTHRHPHTECRPLPHLSITRHSRSRERKRKEHTAKNNLLPILWKLLSYTLRDSLKLNFQCLLSYNLKQ